MNNNIDQLKTEVDDIKKSLNDLKNNVNIPESEKKTKAETLKTQAEVTKQKVQNEINELKSATDEESKKKKEEAEALLNSFNEIMSLYNSIINTWTSNKPSQQALPETESKGVFSNAKDWIWNQWSDVWDEEKWKTEKWANLLRAAWFVATWAGAVALTYKWIKKLFWWWNDEEEEIEEKSKKENEENKEEKDEKDEKNQTNSNDWNKNETEVRSTNETESKNNDTSKPKNDKITQNESQETWEKWGDKISDEMFQQLLTMEGSQNFVAKSHSKKFGEKFVTWPYGMVYKHIDSQGNLLKKPTPFQEWEKVSQERAQKNAKALYDKRAKEWKELLDTKWYSYTQCMLDSLVSTCWWTSKSQKTLKDYVLSHRNNKSAVVDFIGKHATTAAGNGKVMRGLVRRRKFEANWFNWNKQPFKSYKV